MIGSNLQHFPVCETRVPCNSFNSSFPFSHRRRPAAAMPSPPASSAPHGSDAGSDWDVLSEGGRRSKLTDRQADRQAGTKDNADRQADRQTGKHAHQLRRADTDHVEQTHITWMSVRFVRRSLWVSTVGVFNNVRDQEGTTTGQHTTNGGLDNGRRGVCGIRAATHARRCCLFAAAAAAAICTATTLRSPSVA